MEKNRKGQVNLLTPAILALVFAGITLVFGIIISQSIINVDTVNDVSVTVTNESDTSGSIVSINATSYTLTGSSACGFNGPSITAIWGSYNQTNGSQSAITNIATGGYNISILTTNATVSSTGGVTNASTANYPNVSVTYTYNYGDEACTGGNLTVYGLGSFADFWEIIVLAIVITVIIGMLLVLFGGRITR